MVNIYIATIVKRLRVFLIWLNKHINFRMGCLSGIITGSIVFYINIEHGFTLALFSLLRQFSFNLFMGGFNIKVCEKVVHLIKPRRRAILLGTIIPSVQAFVILYSIHYFGNTPKPEASTYWQFGVNLIVFLIMSLYYRDTIEFTKFLKKILDKRLIN